LELRSIYRILLSWASTIRILFVFGGIVVPVILIRPNNKIYYSVQPYSEWSRWSQNWGSQR